MRKKNARRQANRDAAYRVKLAAARKGDGYREAIERAGGQCEMREKPLVGESEVVFRCRATDGLHAHHLTYARFGGAELADDYAVLCQRCHARVEVAYPTRRHGRLR